MQVLLFFFFFFFFFFLQQILNNSPSLFHLVRHHKSFFQTLGNTEIYASLPPSVSSPSPSTTPPFSPPNNPFSSPLLPAKGGRSGDGLAGFSLDEDGNGAGIKKKGASNLVAKQWVFPFLFFFSGFLF